MTKDLTQVNKCFCAITYVFSAFLILCYSICILCVTATNYCLNRYYNLVICDIPPPILNFIRYIVDCTWLFPSYIHTIIVNFPPFTFPQIVFHP